MESIKEVEVQIKDLEKVTAKEEADLGKLDYQIKKLQTKKKNLENKRKEDLHLLEEQRNKKIVLTLESQIGQVDDSKLSVLAKLLDEYKEEIVEIDEEASDEPDETGRAVDDRRGV